KSSDLDGESDRVVLNRTSQSFPVSWLLLRVKNAIGWKEVGRLWLDNYPSVDEVKKDDCESARTEVVVIELILD
ncbi:unnamed protein product, partial [Allacma fusca]